MDRGEMIARLRAMAKDSIGDMVADELERNMFANAVLIETLTIDGTEWGVSFNGSNPECKDYVACASYLDAVRLVDRLVNKNV